MFLMVKTFIKKIIILNTLTENFTEYLLKYALNQFSIERKDFIRNFPKPFIFVTRIITNIIIQFYNIFSLN